MAISLLGTPVNIIILRGQGDKRTKAFREKFAHLGDLRSFCPDITYIALTATATRSVQQEVCNLLQMNDPVIIRESPEKKHIRLVLM